EVDLLEDAEVARGGRKGPYALETARGGEHDLSRLDFADKLGFNEVEGAGLGRKDERVFQATQHERAKSHRITRGDDLLFGLEEQRIGALDLREHDAKPLEERALLGSREQMQDDL